MYPGCSILSLLVLVATSLALSHDEDETTVSPTLKTSKVTQTLVLTVTQTSSATVQPPAHLSPSPYSVTTSYRTGYATPPPPGSVPPPPSGIEDLKDIVPSSTRVRPSPTLICSKPTEACIIDGIAIWPSGTTSIVVPHFTFDPLPTSPMKSDIQSSLAMASSTVASSGSPTSSSKSTTCPHSMSHFVPGKSTVPLASKSSTSKTAATKSKTSQSASLKNTMAILPIDLGTPQPAPTVTKPPTVNEPVQAQDMDITATSTSNNRPGKDLKPSTFSTNVFDPVGWAGIDGALNYTKARRGYGHERQENKATKRRKYFWSRFFAAAEPVFLAPRDADCIPGDRNGAVICLNDTHYDDCEYHCAVP